MAIPFNSTVFVLCSPQSGKDVSLATPVFIEFKEPLALGTSPWGSLARVRSLSSFSLGSEPDWAPAESLLPDGDLTFDALPAPLAAEVEDLLALGRSDLAMCAMVREMAGLEDGWDQFRDALEADRFSANVWFERDRKHLALTDGLTSRDVVSLWDGDVDEAIESGYLAPPRGPRATDSDWLQPLLDYASETGMLDGLKTRSEQKAVYDCPSA